MMKYNKNLYKTYAPLNECHCYYPNQNIYSSFISLSISYGHFIYYYYIIIKTSLTI